MRSTNNRLSIALLATAALVYATLAVMWEAIPTINLLILSLLAAACMLVSLWLGRSGRRQRRRK